MTNEEIDKLIQGLYAGNDRVLAAIESHDQDSLTFNKEVIAIIINLKVIAQMLGEIAKKL